MREIAKGLYSFYDFSENPQEPKLRMWHNCKTKKKRKGRVIERPELEDQGKGIFKCPFCDFKY